MTSHAWGLLTTHHVEEVEALCDRIAIIDAREIVALGTQSDLKAMLAGRKKIKMEADCDDTIIGTFEEIAGKGKVVCEGGMSIMTDDPKEVVRQLFVDFLDEESAQLGIRDPSLEDVFFNLQGGELGRMGTPRK